MGIIERVDRYQRRHRWLGFPIAVVYKFFDDFGGYLVALLAYYGFLSFFPLLLLLSTAVGTFLAGRPELQQQVLSSTLSEFPIIGNQVGTPRGLSGGLAGVLIGSLTALYGGLGVGQAFQYAMNTMWDVPRNVRPNPFAARGRSVLILLILGLWAVLTTGLSMLGSTDLGSLGALSKLLLLVLSVSVSAVIFALAMRRGPAERLHLRQVAPGAVVAALVWQALQTYGVVFVGHVVRRASATNSVFAIVLGLIAFLHLAALGILLAAEVNVVRERRLWPRALLTPFTDNVDLTDADKAAYTAAAVATRSKGQQRIDVGFRDRG